MRLWTSEKTLSQGLDERRAGHLSMLRAKIPFALFSVDTPLKSSGSFPRLEGTGASSAPEQIAEGTGGEGGGCLHPHELQLLRGCRRNRFTAEQQCANKQLGILCVF